MAIVEVRARMVDQGQGGQARDPVVGGQVAVDVRPQGRLVGRSDRPAMEVAIGQAGAMGQQVAEGDLAVGRNGVVQRPVRRAQHPHAHELRRHPADRIVEGEPALLHHRQGRQAGHRLRHRGDAENGVVLHRRPGLQVAPPHRRALHHAPVPPHQGRRAGQLAGPDVFLDGRLDRRRA